MMQRNSNNGKTVREAKSVSFEVRGHAIKVPFDGDHGGNSYYQMNSFDLETSKNREENDNKYKSAIGRKPPGRKQVIRDKFKTKELLEIEEALQLVDFERFPKDFVQVQVRKCCRKKSEEDRCPVDTTKFYRDNYGVYFDLLKYLIARNRPKYSD